MQGKITQTKQWPDGGISIKVDNDWYKTKNSEMMAMQGKDITFTPHPWTNPSSGKVTNWINDYQEVGVSTTPADRAFDQAHQQYTETNPPPIAYGMEPTEGVQIGVGIDTEASIIAQSLTKACSPKNAQDAWDSYHFLYEMVRTKHP